MKKRFIVVAAALACGGVASVSLSAFAQASDAVAPARARQAQLGDPYVPPAARKPTAGTQTTGAALHAQVVRKLARQFGAADTQNTGSITQAQARAAGLGYVANHFRQIDASGSGRVSFSDVQRYMQARSANQQ
ncbi:EF-hand domain-containing protein [Burkholderia anthina]|uniref:EF-hand domain-containing protein n=1 Tax=Burkholderia anthina TaxID=179879 RepID=UPI001CF16FF9|nr:EF-hand domain-containing protein [Burkholderia anthina]MCA8091613.1 EF-hand domain-containing protein [Burkholderia anthina]